MKKKYNFCEKKGTCIKCVLVGDSGVGKSNVAARMSSRNFKEEYQPTLFDNYAGESNSPTHLSLSLSLSLSQPLVLYQGFPSSKLRDEQKRIVLSIFTLGWSRSLLLNAPRVAFCNTSDLH